MVKKLPCETKNSVYYNEYFFLLKVNKLKGKLYLCELFISPLKAFHHIYDTYAIGIIYAVFCYFLKVVHENA